MEWWELIVERSGPVAGGLDLSLARLCVAVGAALAVVMLPWLWRVARLGVTLVHELGHAVVGMLVGRRFTGFVLRADMSGHAITRGKPRGPGLVLTTWAGYPAPALAAVLLLWGAVAGWAAPVLTASLLILLIAWLRVRSLLTFAVMLLLSAALGALWWWREDALHAQVLLGAAVVLLVGAWRHVGAVWRGRDLSSDAAVLGRLTPLPRGAWLVSFAVVLLAATALAVRIGWGLLA